MNIKSGKSKVSATKPAFAVALYPQAKPLPISRGPKNIDIIELVSDDAWTRVLNFYNDLLLTQGWELFATHQLTDRGTLSFRHYQYGTITVLAANENDTTHIRIYIQKT